MTKHFVIVGAQRSGTTSLYHSLEQHPDICMATPVRPEPKFFLQDDAVPLGYRTYLERHFSHRTGETVLGEKSTSYIERTDAGPRLRKILPDATLIFVLRDPVWRAYSNWCFSRANGLETLDFDAALAAEESRLTCPDAPRLSVSPFAYAARGHYVRFLDLWESYFPRKQMLIILSESLFNGSESVRTVFDYMGLNADIPLRETIPVTNSHRAAAKPAIATVKRLRQHFDRSTRALRDRWNVDISAWQ